ncbi:MAG TPA: discoidin domain-containing protein [Pirellulales bacterium]|nr:discoidin domain-containing protein [Pirellulales bacterium]
MRISRTLISVVLSLHIVHPASAGADEMGASSNQPGFTAAGGMDGDRFNPDAAHAWKGSTEAESWWWQCRWSEPREVGAILQVVGDDPMTLQNAPRRYVWQSSLDGQEWSDLEETVTATETRMFRLHRLKGPRRLQYLRLKIAAAAGDYPTLREVEVFDDPQVKVAFPNWIAAVATIDRREWNEKNREGRSFIPLARGCPGWEKLQAQHLWLDSFDEAFVSAEPRPLCAFLSGNFSDFCQKERDVWRGTDEIVKSGRLPIWAACGGAQGLAILADTGIDKPWDCPHCRDPKNPKSPIYGHIGHTGATLKKCGDYSDCLFERGKTRVLAIADDPVLAGLSREFEVMESHCGQIEYLPAGWVQIATKGAGGKTDIQCMRLKDRYVYAAQFHIELAGTPQNSRQIMANFLQLAKDWGGYNPAPNLLDVPSRLEAQEAD